MEPSEMANDTDPKKSGEIRYIAKTKLRIKKQPTTTAANGLFKTANSIVLPKAMKAKPPKSRTNITVWKNPPIAEIPKNPNELKIKIPIGPSATINGIKNAPFFISITFLIVKILLLLSLLLMKLLRL